MSTDTKHVGIGERVNELREQLRFMRNVDENTPSCTTAAVWQAGTLTASLAEMVVAQTFLIEDLETQVSMLRALVMEREGA